VRRTLERTNTPASAFLTGQFIRAHPSSTNQLVHAGLRVGNHSDTHPYFTKITSAQAVAQITDAREELARTAGAESMPVFRFPYGAYTTSIVDLVNGQGYVAVGWTVDTLGWKGAKAGVSVNQVVSRVMAKLQPGEIVLMHLGAAPDGSTLDAAALPQLISAIRARGYTFVTLAALAGW
jgi:peptidoglycan/xylan/chitin deacetylase (PgdA/CDA1 family)